MPFDKPRLVHMGLLAAALTTVASARAQDKPSPRTSSLSWIRLPGADGCVSTQDLAREVETKLDRPVFVSPSRADVSVEGRIEPTKAGWKSTIVLRDAKGALVGTRELARPGASCEVMREPLVLVVAVMIDPDAALRPAPETPATPTPTTTPPPPPPAPTAPAPAPTVEVTERPPAQQAASPDVPWGFEGGLAAVGLAGLVPGLGVGVRADGMLKPPGLPMGRVLVAATMDRSVPTPGLGTATFSLLFAGAGVCPFRSRSARGSMTLCVDAHVGRVAARGEGFDEPRSASEQLHVAGAIEGRMSLLVFGPLAVRFGVAGVVPLIRDSFAYREASGQTRELFRMSPVAGTLDLGVGVIVP